RIPLSLARQIAGSARRSLVKRTTSSVAKWDASAALPPFPHISNLFPVRKHSPIRSATLLTSGSRFFNDSSIRTESLIARLRFEQMLLIAKGVRDRGFEPLTPPASR